MRQAISNILDVRRKFKRVLISTLSCTNPNITDKRDFFDFIKMTSRKCSVTMLLGADPLKLEPEIVEGLKSLILDFSINIFYHPNIHAKHILVDEEDEKLIYLATSNFSYKAFNQNYEIGVLLFLNDPSMNIVFSKYENRFISVIKQLRPYTVYVDNNGDLAWM